MPALLDGLRIPYTGGGVLGMSLAHNKAVAKKMFRDTHIPTANFVVVRDGVKIPAHSHMKFPLFVKPGVEGSSIGINDAALVHIRGAPPAGKVRPFLHRFLILVEEYIEGREFTIGILGDEVLPIVEIISPIGFYSYTQKEDQNSRRAVSPAI